MNREERDKLKDMLKFEISWLERQTRINDGTCHGLHLWFKLSSYKIALEALEAQPVMWEVKGCYYSTVEEAKQSWPTREPEPLFDALPILDH